MSSGSPFERFTPAGRIAPAIAALLLLTASARADVPRVASDIPPVHSLVARVMGELGRPALVLRPGASPHGYALRPSEAAAIESSELVFWTSATLTPWLAREIGKLAPDAVAIELMALDGTRRLAPRRAAIFAPRAGDDGHAGARDDPHDGAPDDPHEGASHDSHAGAPHDPHGWLDPLNARHWLDTIAAALSIADPTNAAVYAANAADGARSLDALIERTDARLEPVRGRPFVVFHDSFQYFEERFDMPAAAALSPDDASAASPVRLHAVRDAIERLDAGCLFTEPQLDPKRARLLIDGLTVGTGTLDPLGATLEPGAMLYERLIDDLADSLVDCLAMSVDGPVDGSADGPADDAIR